ncbi:MAG: hypothetical protein J2P23_15720 [Microlunatus sp.]|nr:hypothetical protein [Microlunatus sp.]
MHAALSAGADEQAFLPGDPTSRLSDLSADDYPRLAGGGTGQCQAPGEIPAGVRG